VRRRRTLVAVALLVLAACSDSKSAAPPSTQAQPAVTESLSGSITVLAASSLTDAFNEMGRQFQAAHPGIAISFSFGASSTLAQQANAGAPADVLATADEPTMQVAVTGGSVAAPDVFAHNRLALLVAKGNPKGIRGLADLARPGLIVVLCAAEVPCGRFGVQALSNAGVKVTPASLEANVRGVVSKVTLGEADAGIVYVTDVRTAGDKVEGVTIPDAQNVLATYPIATVKATHNAALANAFVAYVRSPDGQQVLARAGFAA
jgi:molybdate transport system substrate-binding protein